MRNIIYILLTISSLISLDANAQNRGDAKIASDIYKLLELKIEFHDQLFKIRTDSYEDRAKLEENAFAKSGYGKAITDMKENRDQYISYIDKVTKNDAERLSKVFVDWQPKKPYESRLPDYYFISKLDYLKVVRASLLDKDAKQLLSLGKVPGIKSRYPIVSTPVRPK